MLLLREEHRVIGLREDDFEAALRDEWLPALSQTDGARLLRYLHLAHGSGASYRVITYTALRDAEALGEVIDRVDRGDLKKLSEKLDGLRHDVEAKQLVPLPWSPLQTIDFDAVATEPGEHELSLFMEDTVWPLQGKLEEYIERSGAQYATEFADDAPNRPRLLEIQAAYRTAFGSHRRRNIVLWQRVLQPRGLLHLLTHEVPSEYKQPGRWMFDGLALRDQWRSALLRSSSWSPLD